MILSALVPRPWPNLVRLVSLSCHLSFLRRGCPPVSSLRSAACRSAGSCRRSYLVLIIVLEAQVEDTRAAVPPGQCRARPVVVSLAAVVCGGGGGAFPLRVTPRGTKTPRCERPCEASWRVYCCSASPESRPATWRPAPRLHGSSRSWRRLRVMTPPLLVHRPRRPFFAPRLVSLSCRAPYIRRRHIVASVVLVGDGPFLVLQLFDLRVFVGGHRCACNVKTHARRAWRRGHRNPWSSLVHRISTGPPEHIVPPEVMGAPQAMASPNMQPTGSSDRLSARTHEVAEA